MLKTFSYEHRRPEYDSPAADPISITLAYKTGKAIDVPEAKLAFGFMQKPVDGIQKVYRSNVPEENLFKLKNDVITLKKRTYKSNDDDEEEDFPMIEDSEDEEMDADDDNYPQLTYKQLGYVEERFKNPKFKEVTSSYAEETDQDDEKQGKAVYGKVSVDCGFRPGRVTSYRKSNSKTDITDCFESM